MLDCLIIGGGPPASLPLYISVATTGAPALSMLAKVVPLLFRKVTTIPASTGSVDTSCYSG
jgi:hypothetical protein